MTEHRARGARAVRNWLWIAICAGALHWLGAHAAAQEPPPTAAATPEDDTARARHLFEAGVAKYEQGHYAEALTLFQDAYHLKPHPLVRVNIANCYDKLDEPVQALEHFEGFMSSGEGSETQRAEVRAEIGELEKRIGRLTLNVSPDGARVVIDGHDERLAPIAQPVPLRAGTHRIDVTLIGYEMATRVIELRAQETLQLDIALTPKRAALAVAPPPPLPARPPPAALALRDRDAGSPIPQSVWITAGATFVFGVSAIVTGQLALSANREFDGNLASVRNPALDEYQRAGAWARGVDAANRADAFAAATDVLLGLALVGAGLTTYFYLADREEQRDAKAHTHPLRLCATF